MMKPKKLRWLKRLLTVGLLGAAATYGGGYWDHHQPLNNHAPRYESAVVSRGNLVQAVTASGQLNPVVKVEVGCQISGNIQKLLVDFNSTVQEGQVIAQPASATYEA